MRYRGAETRVRRAWLAATLFALALAGFAAAPSAPAPPAFEVEEATIADIHAAMKAGRLTCRALVEQYLRRIEAYDKNGPAHQRHRRREPRRALAAGRRARPAIRAGRPHRAAALRPDHREGQLRDDRPAERGRVAGAQGVRLEPGRVPGAPHQGGRRHRARQVEHGRVGVHAVRDGELDPARLHEEPVRARSRDGRLERRHGGGGGGQLRRGRPRQRHRQLDSRPGRRTRRSSASGRRWG